MIDFVQDRLERNMIFHDIKLYHKNLDDREYRISKYNGEADCIGGGNDKAFGL